MPECIQFEVVAIICGGMATAIGVLWRRNVQLEDRWYHRVTKIEERQHELVGMLERYFDEEQ